MFPFNQGYAHKQHAVLTKMDSGAQPGMTIIAPVQRTILDGLFHPCAHWLSFRAEPRNPCGQEVYALVFNIFRTRKPVTISNTGRGVLMIVLQLWDVIKILISSQSCSTI